MYCIVLLYYKPSLKILIYAFDSPITRNVVKANSRRLSINSNIFLSTCLSMFKPSLSKKLKKKSLTLKNTGTRKTHSGLKRWQSNSGCWTNDFQLSTILTQRIQSKKDDETVPYKRQIKFLSIDFRKKESKDFNKDVYHSRTEGEIDHPFVVCVKKLRQQVNLFNLQTKCQKEWIKNLSLSKMFLASPSKCHVQREEHVS